jgi:hypothetical protein
MGIAAGVGAHRPEIGRGALAQSAGLAAFHLGWHYSGYADGCPATASIRRGSCPENI